MCCLQNLSGLQIMKKFLLTTTILSTLAFSVLNASQNASLFDGDALTMHSPGASPAKAGPSSASPSTATSEKINPDDSQLDSQKSSLALTIPRSLSPKVSYDEALAIALSKFPRVFAGFDTIAPSARAHNRAFQADLERLRTETPGVLSPEIQMLVEHTPSLVPLVQEMRGYIVRCAETADIETRNHILDLVDEVDVALTPKRRTGLPHVSPAFARYITVRFMLAFGEMTPVEKSALVNAGYGHLLPMGSAKTGNTPYLGFLHTDDNRTGVSTILNNISYSHLNALFARVESRLGFHMLLPVFGQGKLGVSCLTVLGNSGIHLHAFTPAQSSYHGIPKRESTPVGLHLHDTVHGEEGKKEENFVKHVLEKVDASIGTYGNPGQTIKDLVDGYTDVALKVYDAIYQSIEDYHQWLVSTVLPARGIDAYRELMGGLFYMLREKAFFPPELYSQDRLEDVMDMMVSGSIDRLMEASWESPEDPLETSPLTGLPIGRFASDARSYDEGLVQSFLSQEGRIDQPLSSKVTYEPNGPRDEIRGANPEVRFITAKAVFPGDEVEQSYPTLFHKWTNLDDSLTILRFAGIKLQKPDLHAMPALTLEEGQVVASDFADPHHRMTAMNFLGEVQGHLKTLMEKNALAYKVFLQNQMVGDKTYSQNFTDGVVADRDAHLRETYHEPKFQASLQDTRDQIQAIEDAILEEELRIQQLMD